MGGIIIMIQNFNEEAYLEANPKVKAAIEKGTISSVEEHLKKYGLKEIESGKRKFHKDLELFSEAAYLKIFPEAEALIKSEKYFSVFDHFSKVGYAKLLEQKHEKPGIAKPAKKETPLQKEVPVKKELPDEEELIRGFNEEAYLEADPKVKAAIEKGTISSVEEHLKKYGLKEIESGKRKFHPDFEFFNEITYFEAFPEIKSLISKDEKLSAFHHFCKIGYSIIINSNMALDKVRNVENKPINPYVFSNLYISLKKLYQEEDLFYVYTLIKNIDEKEYLNANLDVKKSIDNNSLPNYINHLILHGAKDIMAENRLPSVGTNINKDVPAYIDYAIITSNNSLYLYGWYFSKKNPIKSVYFSNGKYGIDITNKIVNFPRKDLEKVADTKYLNAGFYAYLENNLIDIENTKNYSLILVTENGVSRHIVFNALENNDRNKVSTVILSQLHINKDMLNVMDDKLGLALNKYLQRHKPVLEKEEINIDIFGTQVEKPKVSIIVPLYGRIDFVEFQLSQFANDPFFKKNVELIYVLDDPRLKDELNRLCHGVFPIFEVPFKVVNAHANYGYAVANNIGVGYANASLVLLFNSDLFPLDKTWLPELLKEHDNHPKLGVVCPKLLFEDGAVQHAGMIFERNDELNMWLNEHPGKGLPDLSADKEAKAMPAVTGACMLIKKSLYEEVGGMSENYFLGDFEDSDLCLKLYEKGYLSYYTPSVALCHLERQSQSLFSDASWKGKVTLYNAWQHERKWAKTISAIMKEYNEK